MLLRRVWVFGRRIVTVSLWPFIDWVVTIFANFMLFNYGKFPLGVVLCVASTAILAAILNVGYLWLLYREKWIPYRVSGYTERVLRLHSRIPYISRWRTLAVFALYAVSGPAMLGAPLIWILGYSPRRGYTLAVVGVTINSILWVGGVYNAVWKLVTSLVG